MLHYSLYKNHLITGDPGDRLARPTDVKINTREDLIEDVTGPGSILKPTEVNAVINSYWRRVTDYIRRGEAYSDDCVSIRFSIRGVFAGDEDQFDPQRHEVVVNGKLKAPVTGAAADVPLRKVDGRRIIPRIDGLYDWGSATNDEQLTPGGGLEVSGAHLKIHDNLEGEEGLFFIRQTDGTEFRATQMHTNEPKTLRLHVPRELPPGRYRLEVRNTRPDGHTLRTGTFASVLRVE